MRTLRTNIHVDEDLLARCMRCTGHRTKKAVIEEGLRALLRLDGQRQVRDLRGRTRAPAPDRLPAPRRIRGAGAARQEGTHVEVGDHPARVARLPRG